MDDIIDRLRFDLAALTKALEALAETIRLAAEQNAAQNRGTGDNGPPPR